jgi:hypothetical protein
VQPAVDQPFSSLMPDQNRSSIDFHVNFSCLGVRGRDSREDAKEREEREDCDKKGLLSPTFNLGALRVSSRLRGNTVRPIALCRAAMFVLLWRSAAPYSREDAKEREEREDYYCLMKTYLHNYV